MNRLKLSPCALALCAAFALSGCLTTAPKTNETSAAPATKSTAGEGPGDKAAITSKAGNTLVDGKTMNGSELMAELRTIRGSLSSKNPMQSLNGALMGIPSSAPAKKTTSPAPAPAQAQGLNSVGSLLSSSKGSGTPSLSMASDMLFDSLITTFSYSAVDQFFGQMMDEKDILSKVTVQVPETSKLTPALRRQVLTLSAFVAAIKASGLLIDDSQKDFEAAKASYLRAIENRRNAVKVLGEALVATSGLQATQREGKARGSNFLSDPHYLSLLETFKGKQPEELLNDFAAQNVALAYVKESQPELYNNYRLQAGEVKSHYGAYAKTFAGSTSMLGFSALFLTRAKSLLEKEGANGAVSLLPLVSQGLAEIASLAPRIKKTFASGDEMADGSFGIRVVGQDKPIKSQLDAKRAIGALDAEASGQFKSGLLNSRGDGLLYALYKRSPTNVGAMIDRVASKGTRKAVATDFLQLDDASDFSFQNVYEGKSRLSKAQVKLLSTDLLSGPLISDRKDAGDQAVLKVQDDLQHNLAEYNNSDLRKLIFVVPKQNMASPSLQLGNTAIQIDSLGIAGLAEYDEIAAGSLKQATTRIVTNAKADKR